MNDEDIIKQLGLENATEQIQTQAVNQVTSIVELRVAGIIESTMTDEQLAKFDELKNESSDAVWTWIDSEFTQAAELYEEALNDYLVNFQKNVH